MNRILNYIGGTHREPHSGQFLENFEPRTGKVYSEIPRSSKTEVDLAIETAEKAFPEWSTMPAAKRGEYLNKIADAIDEQLDVLAIAESKDNGKPLWLARKVDIPRAAANFRFFASAIQHFASEAHIMEDKAINYTRRDPLGVVGCISPWNLPLYLLTWKIAPALAAGNCVVAKPSEVTPMTAFLLGEICEKAGLPPGVLNIVHGLGGEVGQALVSHDRISAISFTGGTNTGRTIASELAPKFKKYSLELGGKNPNIIFADCNFEKALNTTVASSFRNQGQICLCGSRILVEREIYEQFRDAFVDKVKLLSVNDPLMAEVDIGAVVSKDHKEKILSYVALAKKEGGKVLVGGNEIHLPDELADGYYVEPTVIEGLDMNCRTNQEEVFGPIVTIAPFDTDQEAVEMANATGYGLSSTIWTENMTKANQMALEVKAGIVWLNTWMVRDLRTPFGGTKESGVGREGGWEALRFFTEPKNVCINLKF